MSEKITDMTECPECNRFHSNEWACPNCDMTSYIETHKERISALSFLASRLIREYQRVCMSSKSARKAGYEDVADMYKMFGQMVATEIFKEEDAVFAQKLADDLMGYMLKMDEDDENAQELIMKKATEKADQLADLFGMMTRPDSPPEGAN